MIRENLQLACGDHPTRAAAGEAALLALPRSWVLSRIEAVAGRMSPRVDPHRLAGLLHRLDHECSSR